MALTEKQKQGLLLGRQKGLKRNRPKGLKYKIVKVNRAWIKKGQHLSSDTEFQKGQNANEKNNAWRGSEVGYHALHDWIKRRLGKPKKCSFCGRTKKVQWANKNFEYKRDINDWFALCYWCHRKYDRANGWGEATKKFPELRKKK